MQEQPGPGSPAGHDLGTILRQRIGEDFQSFICQVTSAFEEQLMAAMLRGAAGCRDVSVTSLLWVQQKGHVWVQIWGCSVSSPRCGVGVAAPPRLLCQGQGQWPCHQHQPRAAGRAGRGFWSRGNTCTGTPHLDWKPWKPNGTTWKWGEHHL